MVNRVLNFMRLGAQETPLEQPDEDQMHFTEVGSTGSQNYAGYPQEEYLRTLTGRQRADEFDKMRRSDTQVVMLLGAVKNPILGAKWFIEPYMDPTTKVVSPEAQQDADLAEQILFKDMAPGWQQFLEEALGVVEFGHAVFEVTHKAVLADPRFGSYNTIAALGFRSQRTIERWNLDTTTGGLKSITQWAIGDLQRFIDIPAGFLLVYSLKREGSNYEGVSMLRPCYGSYLRKDLYLRLNGVGIEKFAVPSPIAEIPEGKENTVQFENLIKALRAFTQHKTNYLTIPAGWKVTLNSNVYDPSKVEQSVDNEDKRMAKAFLANLLELGGSGSTGSYALGAVLEEFFNNSIEHIALKVAAPINDELIPSLIKMNKGPRPGYPKLKHSGISDKIGKEFAETLKDLADSQYITPDDPTEEILRKRIGLPAMSDQGQRKVKAAGALGVDGGGGQMAELKLSERIKRAIARRK